MHHDKDDVVAKRDFTDRDTYKEPNTGRASDVERRSGYTGAVREGYESTKEAVKSRTGDWGEERVHNRRVLSAGSLSGDRVRNNAGEDLGKIEEIMIDIHGGRVAYAVLSFGGFLGMGNKLFAVPWHALTVDLDNHEFVLDVGRETLENAPGFDKSDWPDMADPDWGAQIHRHYGRTPYWEDEKPVNFDKETQGVSSGYNRERGGGR
jgi:sporulation protein YlmC with PRC-barrel domain